MPRNKLPELYIRSYKNSRLIAACSCLLILLSLFGIFQASFDHNLSQLLPQDTEIDRTLQFFAESDFANKVIISLSAKKPHTLSELLREVDSLRQELDKPFIKEVVTGLSDKGFNRDLNDFLLYAPQLLTPSETRDIKEQLNKKSVRQNLQGIYSKMMNPGGSFMLSMHLKDPLGVKTPLFKRLKILSSSMGYQVEIKNGHFVSKDGKHALMIIDTDIPVTDSKGSQKLISYLQEKTRDLPDYLESSIVSGHKHTISNQKIIKSDIKRTLLIAAVGFILLFGFILREARAVLVFIMPSVAIFVALGLMFLYYDTLSYFVLGMGAVVTGIAIDYGIHTYIAARHVQGVENIARIVKPLLSGALTTIGIFAAYYLSTVKAYHQIATFAILSLTLCLAGAVYILPRFFRPGFNPVNKNFLFPDRIAYKYTILSLWCIFLAVSTSMVVQVEFNTDFKALDGTSGEIMQTEKKFDEIWTKNKRDPAILVTSAENREQALQKNEDILEKASSLIGKQNIVSIAAIWPCKETRRENLNAWNKFWQKHEQELRDLLGTCGEEYGFSQNAFQPFFKGLSTGTIEDIGPEQISSIQKLKDRFFLEKKDSFQVLSFFPDKKELVAEMQKITRNSQGTFLVSKREFARQLTTTVASQIKSLAAIAAVLIPLLTILLLRRLSWAALALIPVISGILCVFLAFGILGYSLNAPALFALLVVTGLCIDYGIFNVYAYGKQLPTGTPTAITLSAVSTLIGGGVLLLADHPMFFHVGLTMVSGILAGFLGAIVVIPAIFAMKKENQNA
ncbi:MAG: hypothetical protein ACOCZ2_00260 [Thermodesulfobacteriota bacterium]